MVYVGYDGKITYVFCHIQSRINIEVFYFNTNELETWGRAQVIAELDRKTDELTEEKLSGFET
jgi:hypothetical protein